MLPVFVHLVHCRFNVHTRLFHGDINFPAQNIRFKRVLFWKWVFPIDHGSCFWTELDHKTASFGGLFELFVIVKMLCNVSWIIRLTLTFPKMATKSWIERKMRELQNFKNDLLAVHSAVRRLDLWIRAGNWNDSRRFVESVWKFAARTPASELKLNCISRQLIVFSVNVDVKRFRKFQCICAFVRGGGLILTLVGDCKFVCKSDLFDCNVFLLM